MEPGWCVKLDGDTNYLRELAENFSDPALRIVHERDGYYLASTEFDGMTDSERVRDAGIELVAIACGCAEVELGRFVKPHVSSVRRIDSSGQGEVIVHVPAAVVRLPRKVAAMFWPEGAAPPELLAERPEPPPPRTGEWAQLALRDEDVRDVLAILGREDLRWHDLYHVFEIVKADVGGRIHEEGWATRAEARRFTQTANSRGALGGKHGTGTTRLRRRRTR